MAQFYFTTVDARGEVRTLVPHEAIDLPAAAIEARRVLSDLAGKGLPAEPLDMVSVEIYDEQQQPKLELRLLLEEIRK